MFRSRPTLFNKENYASCIRTEFFNIMCEHNTYKVCQVCCYYDNTTLHKHYFICHAILHAPLPLPIGFIYCEIFFHIYIHLIDSQLPYKKSLIQLPTGFISFFKI